jgi:hypothetical protein
MATIVLDLECHAAFLAEGKYARWIAEYEVQLASLEAAGRITVDRDTSNSTHCAEANAVAPQGTCWPGAGVSIWQ